MCFAEQKYLIMADGGENCSLRFKFDLIEDLWRCALLKKNGGGL